jgi:hypothetical protein
VRDLGFQIIDFSEVKFRLRIASARIWLTYLIATVFAVYAVGTWDGSDQLALVGLSAGYLAWGMLVRLLPLEKIVHSRSHDVFFLAWRSAQSPARWPSTAARAAPSPHSSSSRWWSSR